jgi:mono/diheme cytochrome c family protein
MLRKLLLLIVAIGAGAVGIIWFLTAPATVSASALGVRTADLQNGKTMFAIGGCASCHATPKQDDRTRLGGGLALRSPFGVFYSPNISMDKTDGIGDWTEAEFVTAMMKGTSPDGSHYYPAFPYTSFQNMRVDDVRDLFAYMKTLPAVPGRAPDHDLPFPFNVRFTIGIWKLLFLDGEAFKPDPAHSDVWNRGAYLVNAPGHCGECHSPRNALGAVIASERFAGGPAPDGQGGVPNITQAKLKHWTETDFAELLSSGMTPDADFIGGSMTDVVRNTSQLSAADRAAMAHYLKSLPPVANLPSTSPPSK